MALLNYTTKVAALRSATEIQAALVKAGARQVLTDFDESGRIVGLAFTLNTAAGTQHYHLPVNTAAVRAVLVRQRVAPSYRSTEQAERVAWRIMKDWVEAQLAIIATEMVALDQVMLPYMATDDGRSVYEVFQASQLALGP